MKTNKIRLLYFTLSLLFDSTMKTNKIGLTFALTVSALSWKWKQTRQSAFISVYPSGNCTEFLPFYLCSVLYCRYCVPFHLLYIGHLLTFTFIIYFFIAVFPGLVAVYFTHLISYFFSFTVSPLGVVCLTACALLYSALFLYAECTFFFCYFFSW
jgi:hypothetical protein